MVTGCRIKATLRFAFILQPVPTGYMLPELQVSNSTQGQYMKSTTEEIKAYARKAARTFSKG